ncbi:MAG TPA: trehalose-phosphatase, partial [Anaeromyxobacteraceae bacterium]
AYRDLRQEVDALVGRIHGEFATPDWSPIHYLYRGLSQVEIAALYRAADAVLVTPLRDGMNLVAKEFVAARCDGDGVLVLSEFAGAAAEMTAALLVNPYDVERTAEVFYQALTMPEEERRTRQALLRERVMTRDVHAWAKDFVARLEQVPGVQAAPALSPPEALRQAVERAHRAEHLALLLDYDGTLVPFAATPDLAAPDAALLALLRRLAARRGTEVHLVSGRKRATMERWFASLPVGLFAEHGFWQRLPGGDWKAATAAPPITWREPVLAILREFSDRTPGTIIEEKTAGFAWHYRSADPEYGTGQAKELTLHLRSLIGDLPLEILPGDMVLEVRPRGVNKGLAVAEVRARAPTGTLLLALGDDRTDEDLFAALPAEALAIHVGPTPSRAALRIADVRAARALLGTIAD